MMMLLSQSLSTPSHCFSSSTTTTTTTSLGFGGDEVGGGAVIGDDDNNNQILHLSYSKSEQGVSSSSEMKVLSHVVEWHEFIIIYEGPPPPPTLPSCWKLPEGEDHLWTTSKRSDRKNRQTFCLSLPSSGNTIIHNNNNNSSSDLPNFLSYVSEFDLLTHASKHIGWPSHLLCCRRPPPREETTFHSQPSPLYYYYYPNHSSIVHSTTPSTSTCYATTTATATPTITYHYHHSQPIFLTLHSKYTLIRGGKGGFGTLLRGQSRQAGAKMTTDFGACRDLSGRRLRHVNDELKLRQWREIQEEKLRRRRAATTTTTTTTTMKDEDVDEDDEGKQSLAELELAALRTPSGIRNWHLAIPSWSDMASMSSSNKGRRQMDRQLEREVLGYQRKEEAIRMERERKRIEQEEGIREYVRRGEREGERLIRMSSSSSSNNMMASSTSVKEEILAHLRKRKKMHDGNKDDDDDALDKEGSESIKRFAKGGGREIPVDGDAELSLALSISSCRYLMTLSGELSVIPTTFLPSATQTTKTSKNDSMFRSKPIQRLQSQSDFATAAVLLDTVKLRNIFSGKELPTRGVYIEYTLQTAGLAQIGWVRRADGGSSIDFLPNSDAGDGVGDDGASYGYDGSRGLKFHGGEDDEQGNTAYYGPTSDDATVIGGWKPGDVLGSYCVLRSKTTEKESDILLASSIIEIGYTLNGVDLGIAFTVPSARDNAFHYLYPALSLNFDEVVDVNIGPDFAFQCRRGCVAACELAAAESSDNNDDGVVRGEDEINQGCDEGLKVNDDISICPLNRSSCTDSLIDPFKINTAIQTASTTQLNNIEDDVKFDLNSFTSVEELKALGLDKLKNIMISIGVKCGGTIDERANRLYSLKGLRREEYPIKVRGKNFLL